LHTIANRITFVRIFFIPVFIAVLFSNIANKHWLAAFTFAVIAISDGLDGYYARSLKQVTDFGKIMDPLADKLVIIAALLTLVQVAGLPMWAALVIIGRELIVSVFRLVAVRKDIIISASALGKAKTVFQITAVFFWIFNIGRSVPVIDFFSWLILYVAVLLSLISAVDYFKKFRNVWTLK